MIRRSACRGRAKLQGAPKRALTASPDPLHTRFSAKHNLVPGGFEGRVLAVKEAREIVLIFRTDSFSVVPGFGDENVY